MKVLGLAIILAAVVTSIQTEASSPTVMVGAGSRIYYSTGTIQSAASWRHLNLRLYCRTLQHADTERIEKNRVV